MVGQQNLALRLDLTILCSMGLIRIHETQIKTALCCAHHTEPRIHTQVPCLHQTEHVTVHVTEVLLELHNSIPLQDVFPFTD